MADAQAARGRSGETARCEPTQKWVVCTVDTLTEMGNTGYHDIGGLEFRVMTPVPEPSFLAPLALGVAGLGDARRRGYGRELSAHDSAPSPSDDHGGRLSWERPAV